MNYYITINTNGNITGFYNDVDNKDNIPIDAKQITNEIYEDWVINQSKYIWDFTLNKPVIKEIPLGILKQQKIDEIKLQCSQEILKNYPIYKQLNIINLNGYTQMDKDNMIAFIKKIRDKSNDLEIQINQCITANQINLINW